MSPVALALIVLASIAGDARAQPAPLIEEFFLSRRASTESPGDFEFSSGVLQRSGEWKSGVDFEYGLNSRVQLQIEAPLQRGEGDDESAGFTFALVSSARAKVSAGANIAFGAGERGVSGGVSRLEPFVSASRTYGAMLFQFDALYGRRRVWPLVWTAAMVIPWRAFRGVVEVNHGEAEAPGAFVVAPGIIWKAPKAIELGTALLVPTRGRGEGRGFIVRFTREFDFR